MAADQAHGDPGPGQRKYLFFVTFTQAGGLSGDDSHSMTVPANKMQSNPAFPPLPATVDQLLQVRGRTRVETPRLARVKVQGGRQVVWHDSPQADAIAS